MFPKTVPHLQRLSISEIVFLWNKKITRQRNEDMRPFIHETRTERITRR